MLSRWPWQAFVSLSYKRLPGPLVELRMMFAWLRRVGKGSCRGHPLRFAWVVRRELGETGGRPHLHALIGDLPSEFISRFVTRPKSAVGSWWEALGGGNVRTRPCSATGAAEYLAETC